jgi:hypothetical protein
MKVNKLFTKKRVSRMNPCVVRIAEEHVNNSGTTAAMAAQAGKLLISIIKEPSVPTGGFLIPFENRKGYGKQCDFEN